MSAVADKLREARALIERGWTQEDFAKDESGCEIEDRKQVPVCFCALGAISEAAIGFSNPDADDDDLHPRDFDQFARVAKVLAAALGVRYSREVAYWNDAPERTQAEVLAAFDKAIALAEQEAVTL